MGVRGSGSLESESRGVGVLGPDALGVCYQSEGRGRVREQQPAREGRGRVREQQPAREGHDQYQTVSVKSPNAQ